MKSLPNMVDMKSEKPMDNGMMGTCVSDMPDYDYGLNGSFNRESLDKLKLDDDVHVGDYICLTAMAKVTCVHQKPGENTPDRVDFVMTNIDADDDEDNESEDGA